MQLGGDRVCDQSARVSALVAPQVYVDDDAAGLLQGWEQLVCGNVDLPVRSGAARDKPFAASLNGLRPVKSATSALPGAVERSR